MTMIATATIPDWLTRYYELGFRLVFFKQGYKGPREEGWEQRSDRAEDWLQWVAKHGKEPNVGVFTGHEIAPGRYLADVDIDWAPGACAPLLKILPDTWFGFGRPGKPISHVFYTTSKPLVCRVFEDIAKRAEENINKEDGEEEEIKKRGESIVELRGVCANGLAHKETMIPPSIHPTGESLKSYSDKEIGFAANLERDVTLYAIACLLHKHLGHAFHHNERLATAGFLLHLGFEENEILKIDKAVTEAGGNTVEDALPAVKSTIAKFKAHAHITGGPTLAKAIGQRGNEVISKIRQYVSKSDFILDKNGLIIRDNEINIICAIDKLNITLSQNNFLTRSIVRYNGYEGPFEDSISDEMWLDLDRNFRFRPTRDYFDTVVRSVARKSSFHPIKDYLSGLKWDGTPRVNEWLIRYGGAGSSLYTMAVGAIVLIAAVRRVRHPGCKFDELLVLETSTQGMNKSTALRTLCPREEWFSDDLPLNVDAKQIIERTAGKWIIEAAELKGMTTSRQVEALKAMLSRQTDGPVRLAWGRIPIEQPRQFIIVGTTNSNSYLRDLTGNRRFWPIRVEGFNIEGLRKDRDQIWAEAAQREAQNESIRLPEELYESAEVQQERRLIEEPWIALFRDKWGETEPVGLTPKMIYGALGISADRWNQETSERIATAMQALGFDRRTVRDPDDEGKAVKGWGRGRLKPGRHKSEE